MRCSFCFFVRILAFLPIILMANPSGAQQLAFPGAEGYGRFATGGRGGRVIEVTNLNDSGPGSLRAAIQTSGARTVVFRISGTIVLNSPLNIQLGDITIAGQTAPGDGICIRDYNVNVAADDVIIRYVRFRLGDVKAVEADALGGRFHDNIIVDHCSASWSVDECVSFYANSNFTLQWCLISESLRNSVHSKEAHGYGGIWGGYNASFHHNLLAHHSSRNPRINGASPAPADNTDLRNNVIYNWGFNSTYGGESGKVNMVANYYKYGPATGPKDRIVEPSDGLGKWFVEDNYVFDYPEITADNWAGGVQGTYAGQVRAYEPFPYDALVTHTAQSAFELVLADAGATLPKRDPLDERIVMEARTGTATYGGEFTGPGTGIIDSQDDVGGWPELASTTPPTDDDHDGMADDWELENNLDPTDPQDRNGDLDGDGYTNLEEYLNSLAVRSDFILPPVDLTATVVSPQQVDLKWRDVVFAETAFSIERSQGDTTAFSEIAVVGENDTTYTDSGLAPQTKYFYRIRSYNGTVHSIATPTANATTFNADGTALPASSPIPGDGAGDVRAGALLAWEAGSGATSHNVNFGTTNPPPFVANVTNAQFDPRGLADSTTYYWRIDEVNNAGETTGPVWSFVTESYQPQTVAYWSFNRGLGSRAEDETEHDNDGSLINMGRSSWVDGILGKALQFDGQGGYVQVPDDRTIDFDVRSFTIAFMLRQSDASETMPWISRRSVVNNAWGSGFAVYHDAGGQVRFAVSDADGESVVSAPNTDFVTGDWVLVTAVRNRETDVLELYANANLIASASDTTWNLSHTGDLLMGTNAAFLDFFEGRLDECYLFNYALDASEISALYGTITSVSSPGVRQYQLKLNNYPNPFNPSTKINYTLPRSGKVTLKVFNLLGQIVATFLDSEEQAAGEHVVTFDAAAFGGGVYFCRLEIQGHVKTQKMLLLK